MVLANAGQSKRHQDGKVDIAHKFTENGVTENYGFSEIHADGSVNHHFVVPVEHREKQMSTRMVAEAVAEGFERSEALFLRGSTNYEVFCRIYLETGDEVAAAMGTPAGRALRRYGVTAEVSVNTAEKIRVTFVRN